jgi:parallel beta helix pectate lyase-like protein
MTNRLMAIACGVLVAAIVSSAGATSPQRTFVSGGGNDANPCSLASPCRSFTAAVAAVAAKGEVIILDSAAYGTVTITKSVSLIAPSGIYAGVTVSTGDGITVNAPGGIVVLRGLSINGQGGDNGINLLQAERLRIESCVVSNMAVDGIMHSAGNAELIVLDTIVRDNGGSGIGGDANAFVVLDHVRSEHNGTNGFYLASFSALASATITDSVFAFNGSNGIWIAATSNGSTAQAQVERSVLANNLGVGIKVSTAGNSLVWAGVTRNAIHGNGAGVTAIGSDIVVNMSDNTIGQNNSGVTANGIQTKIFINGNHITESRGSACDFTPTNGAAIFTNQNNNVTFDTVVCGNLDVGFYR